MKKNKNKLRILITATIACAMVFAMAAFTSCNNGNDDYWRQRFDALQSRQDYLDKENQRLQDEFDALQAKLDYLERENKRLQNEIDSLQTARDDMYGTMPMSNTNGVFEVLYMPGLNRRRGDGGGGSGGFPRGISMMFSYNENFVYNSNYVGASRTFLGWHYYNNVCDNAPVNPPFVINFHSSREVVAANLVFRLAASINHFILSPNYFEVKINNELLYFDEVIIYANGPLQDFILTNNLVLPQGWNEIRIRVLPNTKSPVKTTLAPLFAHVRIENFAASLWWRPQLINFMLFNPTLFGELLQLQQGLSPLYRNPWNR